MSIELRGVKFQPGEYKLLGDKIKANDQTPAGRNMTAAALTQKLSKELTLSRPITVNVVTRIRAGKPAFLQNDAVQKHISFEDLAAKMSVADLLGMHQAWIEKKIPLIVQKAESLMEQTEAAIDEVFQTMDLYQKKILVDGIDPLERINTDHLMEQLMSLAGKLQKTGGGRLPQQAVPGIE